MDGFDLNGDVSLNTLKQGDEREFQFADRNRDGALNFEEFGLVESMYQCSLSDHLRFFSIS